MNILFGKWIRIRYNKITESIAFYPAIIAICFLLLSWGMLEIDFSPSGKHLKAGLSWLSLKDASTARSIVSTVAGAVISLTVFSFSMVMIVLNQAASQMSNRVLSSMIENRFQQVVLGFYIGTIVYALFLLSTIRDIDSGVYVPALSIYLLIVLTVMDIFLFIYFLDYVTQTVKYETVIHRVEEQTMQTMKRKFSDRRAETVEWTGLRCIEIPAAESNYFQGFNEKKLLRIACDKNLYVSFIFKPATYVIKGSVYMLVYGGNEIDEDCLNKIISTTDFFKGQPIERNADYGFSQLAEVAIKALSPGINDPATAVISLHALTSLLAYRLHYHPAAIVKDKNNEVRIIVQSSSFKDLFEKSIYPIWKYGLKDQYIQDELILMMNQLKKADRESLYKELFGNLTRDVKIQQQINIG